MDSHFPHPGKLGSAPWRWPHHSTLVRNGYFTALWWRAGEGAFHYMSHRQVLSRSPNPFPDAHHFISLLPNLIHLLFRCNFPSVLPFFPVWSGPFSSLAFSPLRPLLPYVILHSGLSQSVISGSSALDSPEGPVGNATQDPKELETEGWPHQQAPG